MSRRLVGLPAFKAGGTGGPRPAGSIPVRLRSVLGALRRGLSRSGHGYPHTVPSRAQVLRAYEEAGRDFGRAAERLGMAPGLAYMVATGLPADGGDAPSPEEDRVGAIPASPQTLVYGARVQHPTHKKEVERWLRLRSGLDPQMREAAES